MASNKEAAHAAPASGMDYPEHERTYNNFVYLVTYGTIVVVGIVVLMAVFLV